jgi:HAD superfamily hydrolase (TIGR01490 family)
MKQIAIFDLDNTILSADSEFVFCEYLAQQHLVDTAFLERIGQFFREYEDGTIDYNAYEKSVLRPLAGISQQRLGELMAGYLARIQPLCRQVILAKMAEHKAQGYVILMASSANQLLAEPIARMVGIEELICTKLEIQNGLPSGELLGEPAFREGKIRKIQAWIQEKDCTLEGSWAYSDSFNDLPLLQFVQNPVAVTPDERLRRHARENGWQIIDTVE